MLSLSRRCGLLESGGTTVSTKARSKKRHGQEVFASGLDPSEAVVRDFVSGAAQ